MATHCALCQSEWVMSGDFPPSCVQFLLQLPVLIYRLKLPQIPRFSLPILVVKKTADKFFLALLICTRENKHSNNINAWQNKIKIRASKANLKCKLWCHFHRVSAIQESPAWNHKKKGRKGYNLMARSFHYLT